MGAAVVAAADVVAAVVRIRYQCVQNEIDVNQTTWYNSLFHFHINSE